MQCHHLQARTGFPTAADVMQELHMLWDIDTKHDMSHCAARRGPSCCQGSVNAAPSCCVTATPVWRAVTLLSDCKYALAACLSQKSPRCQALSYKIKQGLRRQKKYNVYTATFAAYTKVSMTTTLPDKTASVSGCHLPAGQAAEAGGQPRHSGWGRAGPGGCCAPHSSCHCPAQSTAHLYRATRSSATIGHSH